jgi:hypothetical protein
MTEAAEMQMLKDAAARLAEYFDSVQIFVTRHESDEIGTVAANEGSGNWLARWGQVNEWVIKNRERARIRAKQEDED